MRAQYHKPARTYRCTGGWYTHCMLSLFPQLLFLAPYSATILRITAGIVFLSVAWVRIGRREEQSRINFIVVGHGMWIPIVAALVEFAVALALIAGIYTQLAALFGALLALKSFVWKGRYDAMFPLSRTTSVLLMAICVSLVLTGAGMLAFDLPL